MKINFSEIQRNVSDIANRREYTIDVLYELMAAYGRSASSITKLRNGIFNLAEDKEITVLQRGVVYFRVVTDSESLPAEVEKLEQDPLTQRYNPRFLIATDLKTFAAKDTKKENTLEIAWADIDRNVDFFYGWTGDEVTDLKTEAVADRRAADKMKELYQEIEKVNADKFKDLDKDFRHQLNVFFTRLLFCFFAEDTKVFSREDHNLFTNSIRDFTQIDGSDLDEFLGTLFESLDEEDKSKYTSPYSKFPYVNGKLFDRKKGIAIPKFSAQARHLILSCGALNWSEINPDIFGSMFQGIVDEEYRSTHGMHYTSVPNIMKTIEPLFLDELREEFDTNYDNKKKLEKLHDRIAKIKVFDPACGSGNFLIIAYKEIRKLEHAIIERQYDDEYKRTALAGKLKSRIELDNFYGIELDDFACEVAVLSLYLAKHQMNIEFEKQFGKEIKLIPLKDNAHIRHGNAARIDWQEVCPNIPTKRNMLAEQQGQLIVTEDQTEHLLVEEEWEEIYLISNPPYLGQRNQKDKHREDLELVFDDGEKYKKLDYVSIWFYKGAAYISNTNAKLAFVSTDSITQGVQVNQLWKRILKFDVSIIFAHSSFKWRNSAKDNAGVSCVVIGLASIINQSKQKYIFTNGIAKKVFEINPYLAEGKTTFLDKHNTPISKLPRMISGNQPREGGYLMLTPAQKTELVSSNPKTEMFVRKMIGADELIKGKIRWCIWIDDNKAEQALEIPELSEIISKVKAHREKGNSVERSFANTPHKFVTTKLPKKDQIVLPSVSSESREYIPISIVNRDTIVTSSCFCIFDADLYIFSVLNSLMHFSWVKTVSGRLETRINYASNTCYNSFPLPELDVQQMENLRDSAKKILLVRQNHTEKTLAEMYDPNKMPTDLREAHHQNDLRVDKLYRQKPYANDEERLADLFKLYEEMIANEKR